MADRSDENKKQLSIEELNAWNVEKLQKYLKNRGVVITSDTRKRDLVSKVYHARSIFFAYLALPVLVTFHYQGASNINCSAIVFILEVCRLSLPVSSATYDVTFKTKKTCLFPWSCVQMVENVSDNLGHNGRSR